MLQTGSHRSSEEFLKNSISHLEKLVGFETISANSNFPVIEYFEGIFSQFNVRTKRIGQVGDKTNLLISAGPNMPGGIVLSGHTDVVPVEGQAWTTDPYTLTHIDDRLYGRGSTDMLGFVSLAISAAQQASFCQLKRPLHLALSFDEEVGCLGVGPLADAVAHQDIAPDLVIVGEPSQMRMVTSHKGGLVGKMIIRGVPGHASNPNGLVNAIEVASAFMNKLSDYAVSLRDTIKDTRFVPPYPTFQATIIKGGEHSNIIPGHCEFHWEFRILPGQDSQEVLTEINRIADEEIEPKFRAQNPAAKVTVQVSNTVPPLGSEMPQVKFDLASSLVGSDHQDAVAYGSEAGFFETRGLATIICGPGSIEQAHKPDEYIEISQLEQGVEFMGRVIETLEAKIAP